MGYAKRLIAGPDFWSEKTQQKRRRIARLLNICIIPMVLRGVHGSVWVGFWLKPKPNRNVRFL